MAPLSSRVGVTVVRYRPFKHPSDFEVKLVMKGNPFLPGDLPPPPKQTCPSPPTPTPITPPEECTELIPRPFLPAFQTNTLIREEASEVSLRRFLSIVRRLEMPVLSDSIKAAYFVEVFNMRTRHLLECNIIHQDCIHSGYKSDQKCFWDIKAVARELSIPPILDYAPGHTYLFFACAVSVFTRLCNGEEPLDRDGFRMYYEEPEMALGTLRRGVLVMCRVCLGMPVRLLPGFPHHSKPGANGGHQVSRLSQVDPVFVVQFSFS
jgi:hypothetical protein